MLQEALKKIQTELAEKAKDKYVQVIGAFLIDHIRNHPEHAALILTNGKTIAGSLSAMKEEARKNQSNGVGILTDEEGFAVVLKFFGVEVKQPEKPVEVGFSVDIDTLL